MEPMNRYYKIHLHHLDDSEVRRFRVHETSKVNYNFQAFREQVEILFPQLKDKTYIVYCKDEDDDIEISSSPEYIIATELMTNILTFHIKLPQEEKRPKPTKEDVVHIGITCDGCNAHNITGFRYKCIECENYDLCSQCEAKGEHPYHHMIRIPQQLATHRYRSFFHHLRKGLKKTNLHSSRRHGSCDYTLHRLSPWIETSIPFLNDFITTLLFEKDEQEGPNSSQAHKAGKEDEPMDVDTSRKFPGEGKKLVDDTTGDVEPETATSSRRESLATSTTSQENSEATVAPTDEWTILDKSDNAEINQTSPASSNTATMAPSAPKETSETQPIYPELPKEEVIYHPDPMINEVVQTMMGMGFSNQGGLLTYVVAAEKGDINKILEILQPTHK